jgi:DNA-binding MarR family transcriptional regulator
MGDFDIELIDSYVRAQRFYFLAEQSLNLIQKRMMALLRDYDLNHAQHLVLLILWYAEYSRNDIMSTELAYLLGLEKHSISSVVDILCKRGLVRRRRNQRDRRILDLRLTDNGRDLVRGLHPKTIKTIAKFPECTDAEYQLLAGFMENLRDLYAEENGQEPKVYRDSYTKLLVDGEKKFVEALRKENGDGQSTPA